jgi:hypothetical protein
VESFKREKNWPDPPRSVLLGEKKRHNSASFAIDCWNTLYSNTQRRSKCPQSRNKSSYENVHCRVHDGPCVRFIIHREQSWALMSCGKNTRSFVLPFFFLKTGKMIRRISNFVFFFIHIWNTPQRTVSLMS